MGRQLGLDLGLRQAHGPRLGRGALEQRDQGIIGAGPHQPVDQAANRFQPPRIPRAAAVAASTGISILVAWLMLRLSSWRQLYPEDQGNYHALRGRVPFLHQPWSPPTPNPAYSPADARRAPVAPLPRRGLLALPALLARPARAAPVLRIGSKNFTEQLVVAELFAQGLERAGAKVERRVNLGGTAIAQASLLSGEIDLYPEYTGTGLGVVLKQKPEGTASRGAGQGPRRLRRRSSTSPGSTPPASTTAMRCCCCRGPRGGWAS